VLNGRVPDEEACVELGMAHAYKELLGTEKLLVGLQSDSHAAFLGSKLNPMLRVPLEHIAEAENELLKTLGGTEVRIWPCKHLIASDELGL
jgi:hypothetical protein